jgi:hypothetical protein
MIKMIYYSVLWVKILIIAATVPDVAAFTTNVALCLLSPARAEVTMRVKKFTKTHRSGGTERVSASSRKFSALGPRILRIRES